MVNVIDLREVKRKKLDLKNDFKIKLNTPLNLGLPAAPIPAPASHPLAPLKKATVRTKIRRRVTRLLKLLFEATILPVRDRIYRKAGDRLLGELVTLAVRLNRCDFHVFVDFSGHVGTVRVRVYPGGWRKDGAGEILVLEGKLPGRCQYARMGPKDIRTAMKVIKSLSKLNRHRRFYHLENTAER